MRTKILAALLASVMVAPALAQDRPATRTDTVRTTTTSQGSLWRASKLVGLDVYNDQNEKLGDISEILMDKSGKVEGVIIGVGGFLGLGQNDIKVEMSKLKFVDDQHDDGFTGRAENHYHHHGRSGRHHYNPLGRPQMVSRPRRFEWCN